MSHAVHALPLTFNLPAETTRRRMKHHAVRNLASVRADPSDRNRSHVCSGDRSADIQPNRHSIRSGYESVVYIYLPVQSTGQYFSL